jgi:hypothetical protein
MGTPAPLGSPRCGSIAFGLARVLDAEVLHALSVVACASDLLLLVGIILAPAAKLVSAIEGDRERRARRAGRSGPADRAPESMRRPAAEIRPVPGHPASSRLNVTAPACPVALDSRSPASTNDCATRPEHRGVPRSLLDFAWEVGVQIDLARPANSPTMASRRRLEASRGPSYSFNEVFESREMRPVAIDPLMMRSGTHKRRGVRSPARRACVTPSASRTPRVGSASSRPTSPTSS